MPSLIDFRRRIRSVKNTQQITRAMKLVAAAKLRRAQEAVTAARPFAAILQQMLENVALAAAEIESVKDHPLLVERPESRALVLLVTADRGLAGAFSTNVNRGVQRFIAEKPGVTFEIAALGKKGRDYYRRRNFTISNEYFGLSRKPLYSEVSPIAQAAAERYAKGEVDAVYLAFNEFKNVVSHKLNIQRILPVPLPEQKETRDYIFEQPPEELLASLLPRYVEIQLFRSVLESTAAEHAARMTAMDAATTNANDVIDRLTLHMNRVRQASITREIIEVVSGASALD